VYIPTTEAWREILVDGRIDSLPCPMPDWVKHWLDDYGSYAEAALGLVKLRAFDGWFLLQILKMPNRYLRVHFENVICEHCGQRCGPSATPDFTAYAGSACSTTAQACAEFDGLPIKQCPHCGGVLRRRQTLWLAAMHGE
jgi:hypothetical protein